MQFVHKIFQKLNLDRGRVAQAFLAAILMLLGMGTFKPGMPSSTPQPILPAPAPVPEPAKIVIIDGSSDEVAIPLEMLKKPRVYSQKDAIFETDAVADPRAWYLQHKAQIQQGLERPIVKLLLRRHLSKLTDPADVADVRQMLDRLDRGDSLRGIDPARVTRFLERIIPILEMIVPFVPPPYNVAVEVVIEFLKLILANRLTPEMIAAEIAPRNFMLTANVDMPIRWSDKSQITLEELYDRVDSGEEITIAVGVPATGRQLACAAPQVRIAYGRIVTKPPGVYRVYLLRGAVVVEGIPKCIGGNCPRPSK